MQISFFRLYNSIKYLLVFGFPLFMHHGANFAKAQLDRMVLYPLYPAEQIGVYSAGLQVAIIFFVLLTAINKAGVPYYYQAIKNGCLGTEKIRYWTLWSLPVTVLPALLAWLLPESLFLWLLGSEYVGVKWYVCLFLIGSGLYAPYFILVNYLFYHGRNGKISAISLLSAGSYLAVLLATVPLGPKWTPLAMIAGGLVILPLLYRQVKD